VVTVGRPAKHDWAHLHREYLERRDAGRYGSLAAFAQEKGLHPMAVSREFRRLANGEPPRGQKPPKPPKVKDKTSKTKHKPIELAKKDNETKPGGSKQKRSSQVEPFLDKSGRKLCGARTRATGGSPCRRPAGWGTDHPGSGRCKLHGGCAGPPGNQHTLKHGLYAQVIRERLTPQEQAVYDAIPFDQDLWEELRIIRFKILRLLEPVEREAAFGTDAGVEIVTLKVDEVTKADVIRKLVAEARAIIKDLKDTGQDDGSLDDLLKALAASRKAVESRG